MSLFQNAKPKSAGKTLLSGGEILNKKVIETLGMMRSMAGSTLGPGGAPVLIERPEMGMKPIITKDGVTVIKHLGFNDSVSQLVLESARDASLRTASEAGDGTTTSTILSHAIASGMVSAISENNHTSPQGIIRAMKALIPKIKEKIKAHTLFVDSDNYEKVLSSVATLSANGDLNLSSDIMESFSLVGEEGNLTIVESIGETSTSVEKISGYTVDQGYEESLKKFSNDFINDKSGTMIGLDKPVFLLFDGVINDTRELFEAFQAISVYWDKVNHPNRNIVLVAHGFSDLFLADMHQNWIHPKTMNILPLLTPQTAIKNWRTHFLYDLQAYTQSPVFNPLSRPIQSLDPESLTTGNIVESVECSRFRTSVMTSEDSILIDARIDELQEQLKDPESGYEENDLNVRIGKLSSGIARLHIVAPTIGESRERRDRAEDAWMAIRGAAMHGSVAGGGHTLLQLSEYLAGEFEGSGEKYTSIAAGVLSEAFCQPVRTIYSNYGYSEGEIDEYLDSLRLKKDMTFDISAQKWVPFVDLLDSVPALSEAIESSISIASLLGSLGGIISFNRNADADAEEQRQDRDFVKSIGGN